MKTNRMEQFIYLKYYIIAGIKFLFHKNDGVHYSYLGKRKIMSIDEMSILIGDKIASGKPFVVTRFGSGEELATIKTIEKRLGFIKKIPKANMDAMCINAGFFPYQEEQVMNFGTLIETLIPEIDILAAWKRLPMEKYLIDRYMGDIPLCSLNGIEPFLSSYPWSKQLAGKKVLVIHPFTETIKKQYENREHIFKDKNVLPQFDLKCIKAVQTIAGNKDSRFKTWFEALDYMYEEALKIDFDIALIGCGAYGMPLAIKIKQSGKQAIHLGGALQLLFGIEGKRWDTQLRYNSMYNEFWCKPSKEECPNSNKKIENGCYW